MNIPDTVRLVLGLVESVPINVRLAFWKVNPSQSITHDYYEEPLGKSLVRIVDGRKTSMSVVLTNGAVSRKVYTGGVPTVWFISNIAGKRVRLRSNDREPDDLLDTVYSDVESIVILYQHGRLTEIHQVSIVAPEDIVMVFP